MSGEVFNDEFMLEIFRAEVETHAESLTAGLLALERAPGDTSQIDEMMRGAHSIKGAARIVGIDPAVRIAHVMEDGFIAAQNGKLTLRPFHVDTLLRGVDMLSRIANGSRDPQFDATRFSEEAVPLVAEITAVLSQPADAAGTPATAVPQSPPSASPMADHTAVHTDREPDSDRRDASPHTSVTIPLPAFLDARAAEAARLAFVDGLTSGASTILFDLSATTDLDAVGLAFLAAVPQQPGSGCRAELFGTNSDLQRVLHATGVDRLYAPGGN